MNMSLRPQGEAAHGFAPLSPQVLGQLMPMFLWLDQLGTIRAVGPTLAKILGPGSAVGAPFGRYFRLGRARVRHNAASADSGALTGGRRVLLTLTAQPDITLRGNSVDLGETGAEGVVLNLTFGIQLADAVRHFALSEADFAPSDLAMELLYLQEAKAAVLSELGALNLRLEDARRSAMTQALTDPLTGLANRRAFDLALCKAIEAQSRRGSPFALAHLDLDFFKAVNDTMGHAAGDQVLAMAARVLREETRRGDIVARVGGDEFILLLRGPITPDRICVMGRRIITRLEEPCEVDGGTCRISGSMGAVISSDYAYPEPERLLADADAALYASKRRGRARCTLGGPRAETDLPPCDAIFEGPG